jgi:geranylgeranyl reductase family protein
MNDDSRVDVLVVGGGPAGSAAAITAARAGLRTLLVDKAVFPREKTCGDGLTAGALRHLEMLGLEPAAIPSWTVVRETVVCSPSGRRISFPLPGDGVFAAVAPRAELDAALVDVARTAGAGVREGCAAEDVVPDGDGLRVHLAGDGEVRARFVIAADGIYSAVRKRVLPRAAPYLGELHAFRQYFGAVADPRLWVFFEPDLLPGYAWVFPLPGGRANVGFGVHRAEGHSVQSMNQQWRDLLDRPSLRAALGPDAVADEPHRAWPIPADIDGAALTHGRVLFAGDAAAVTDPMTGEGIGQALLTGRLAATTIARGGDPAVVAARYRAAVARDLAPDLRFARALLVLLRSPLGARGAVRLAGLSPWTRRNFARWLFEDYPRALVLTPSRWTRGAMTGAGAYARI